ncbi:MAG: outer membrane protein assembly factor BamE [Ottowia sp.]|nr:outer membrane protein assembly factor BamE [Ottowia sp.]
MFLTGSSFIRLGCRLVLAAVAASLLGCSTFDDATQKMANALTLYKPEVIQGNFVSREQVQALQPGMTRLQVREILGTPLVTSLFHADRWDYVFTLKRQGVEPQQYHLTTWFSGDALSRIEGDEMPSETEFVERISPKHKVKVPELEATDAQLARFPDSNKQPAEPVLTDVVPAAPGAYPPLEGGS